MAERASALDGQVHPGVFGVESEDGPGIVLTLLRDLTLFQVAAWPDTLGEAGEEVRSAAGVDAMPGPGTSATAGRNSVLRIEPLKWWIIGAEAPALASTIGATLDLSHSRTRVRVSGPDAAALLNRFLPLDLRESAFPEGAVASSALHHVGVTLWRNADGYELFIPRGFALSCWEVLEESARQFGLEVRDGNHAD